MKNMNIMMLILFIDILLVMGRPHHSEQTDEALLHETRNKREAHHGGGFGGRFGGFGGRFGGFGGRFGGFHGGRGVFGGFGRGGFGPGFPIIGGGGFIVPVYWHHRSYFGRPLYW